MGHPKVSLSSTDDVAIAVSDAYERTVPDALSQYPWKFAQRQLQITRSTPPFTVEGFDYAYQIPNDCINVVTVVGYYPYEIFQDYIFTNESSPINLEYTTNAPASLFPPYFVDALIKELASRLAIAVTEDVSRAERFRAEAVVAWRLARHRDSKIQTSGGFGQAITNAIAREPTWRP